MVSIDITLELKIKSEIANFKKKVGHTAVMQQQVFFFAGYTYKKAVNLVNWKISFLFVLIKNLW